MKSYLIFLFFPVIIFLRCSKDNCNIKKHNNPCTMDCPGVCGCDGKTYCNECVAGWEGIKIVSSEPCK